MKTGELDKAFCELGTWKCRLQYGNGKSNTCSCVPGNRACEYTLKVKPQRDIYRLTPTGRVLLRGNKW